MHLDNGVGVKKGFKVRCHCRSGNWSFLTERVAINIS